MLGPPIIVEELSVCSTQIRLRNQMHKAKVEVFIEGNPTPIVDVNADWPDQWFAFRAGVTLTPRQTVRARQTLNAEVSELSTDGAVVQERATSQPYFVAPLVACSSIAVVNGFTPGATVTITDSNGSALGSAIAAGSQVVVQLSRTVINREVLHATAAACGAPAGGSVSSLPAEPMGSGEPQLRIPTLDPVSECQRVLKFGNVRVGAILKLRRGDGSVVQWTCSASDLHGRIDPPITHNEMLAFWQEPPERHCEVNASAEGTATAGPPGIPNIKTRPCPGSKWLEVHNLAPSATVKVLADNVEILMFEAPGTVAEVDLGKVVLTPGQRLAVVQGLCGVFGAPSPVPSWVTVAPFASNPSIPERLYACAGVVRVTGIAGASRVNVFSDKAKGRIGHTFTEADTVDIHVNPPLIPGDRIYAFISGCAEGTAAREVEPMLDMPPFIVVPPREGDRSVVVKNLLPGSRVDVVIDGNWQGGLPVGGTDERIPVSEALITGQSVEVTVRLCSQIRSAKPVNVLPPVDITWTRPTLLALDTGGGHFISGRVTAAVLFGGGRAVLGTEEAGLWLATPTSTAMPLSLDWSSPLIHSLIRGVRGNDHLYCGTENGIMESDTTKPIPLLSWLGVNGIPATNGPGGTVWDLLVINGRLYAATNTGLWWSTIPASAGPGYAWTSDPLVNQIDVRAICEGPNGSVVGYGLNSGAGVVVRGVWSGGTVTWSNVTPGAPGPVADPRLTTVATRMRNGHLASCAADRNRICAAFEDTDNAWLAVLRSDDGGATWSIPYVDRDLVFFKPVGGTVDMGFQADRNLRVAFHPNDRNKILLAGRRTGLLGSTDGGVTWDTATWPDITNTGTFHADCLCMAFDPTDPTGNTLLTGSDGGAFLSTDFGRTWDTGYNRTLTTLMFDQPRWSAAPALSASEAFPGLVVGAFQDNGKGYLTGDGEPWRELNSTGDGERALFVTSDIVMSKGNDEEDLKWARWDGTKFVDEVTVEPPAYPAGTSFNPFFARVPYPARTDSATGAKIIAVAGDNQPSGKVWGLFDRGAAHAPRSERLYWLLFGTVPFRVNAVASLTGTIVLVGAKQSNPDAAHVYLLDSLTSIVTEMTLPANLQDDPRWLTVCGGTTAFMLIGDRLLQTDDFATWRQVSTTPNVGEFNVIAVDRGEDPVRLFLAGSNGIWSSRDFGATWVPTKGNPRHPRANHLEVVQYAAGQRVAYLGTWNWSIWRAILT